MRCACACAWHAHTMCAACAEMALRLLPPPPHPATAPLPCYPPTPPPPSLQTFRAVLLRVDDYNAARIKMTAEMADSSNLAKTLVIKARDRCEIDV